MAATPLRLSHSLAIFLWLSVHSQHALLSAAAPVAAADGLGAPKANPQLPGHSRRRRVQESVRVASHSSRSLSQVSGTDSRNSRGQAGGWAARGVADEGFAVVSRDEVLHLRPHCDDSQEAPVSAMPAGKHSCIEAPMTTVLAHNRCSHVARRFAVAWRTGLCRASYRLYGTF